MIKYICLFALYTTAAYANLVNLAASKPITKANSASAPTTQVAAKTAQASIDRFENYNRNAYRMNSKIDKIIIRPAAVGYITYVPLPIRSALSNFFNNLRDFVTLGNDILQLNGQSSMKNIMRISINTTFGLVGILDISSSIGLVQNKNSFGNTMKVYGWEHSSYYIIPLLGPSTVRDAIGEIPDTILNPTWYLISNNYISTGLYIVDLLDKRSQFLGFDQLLNTSIDPYVTMRDTYLAAVGETPPQHAGSDAESNGPSIDSLIEEDTPPSKK